MKLVLGRDDLAVAAASAIRGTGTQVERLDVRPVHKAARGMIGQGSVDICELPIVTLLQAVAHDHPVILLPVTVLARAQHQTLVTCGDLTVENVQGRSVGVRSWSQTTGVWMRGILAEEYGVDLRRVDWVVYEGGHVDEHHDPSWVRRAPEGVACRRTFSTAPWTSGSWATSCPPTTASAPPSPTPRRPPPSGPSGTASFPSTTSSASRRRRRASTRPPSSPPTARCGRSPATRWASRRCAQP
ncbi:hypothetical protein ACFQ0B_46930 [Nonomuraea thailandensis]